jgi:hypothetical protein
MSLFRKESGDILDFTILQKRGLLKKDETSKTNSQINERAGSIDLTPTFPSAPQSITSVNNSQPQDLFGFLDSKSEGSSISFTPEPTQSKEVEHLKVKIDDLEYKIERLLEKLALLESKIAPPL